eukprot:COSAG06_NODE_54250_length_295_cov_1.316327_1_plen_51_part_01
MTGEGSIPEDVGLGNVRCETEKRPVFSTDLLLSEQLHDLPRQARDERNEHG